MIWEKCKGGEWNPFEKKGCKRSKNRFMGPIEKGIDEEDMWTINYLGCMHCCMEEGWLSDAKMRKIMLYRLPQPEKKPPGPQNKPRHQLF